LIILASPKGIRTPVNRRERADVLGL